MKKIMLVCAAGMSTSLLVENMKKAAAAEGVEAKIWAVSESVVANEEGNFDILLLGPQIRFRLNAFKKAYGDKLPVEMIDMRMYGRMDGKAVLETALNLLGK